MWELFSRSEVEVAGIHSVTNVMFCKMADGGEKLQFRVSFLCLNAKTPNRPH